MLRIKELREAKGISMKEAARLLDLPYTTYVNYEKGLREPTSELLILISDFFGVSVDYLLGRTDADSTPINPYKFEMPPRESSFSNLHKGIYSQLARELMQNSIDAIGRDGSVIHRTLTDEQFAAIKAILSQLPDASDDL